MRKCAGRSSLLLAVWLLGQSVGGLSTFAAEGTRPAAAYTGRPLTEVLLELREQGLKIVFSSNVVRPEMWVLTEPDTAEPRALLEQILAPHGLAARDGPGGTVVVVPIVAAAPPERVIQGTVRARVDDEPIGGASVRVEEWGVEVTSAGDGGFLIPLSGSEPVTIEVAASGFLVERIEGVRATAAPTSVLVVQLDPTPVIEERLVVSPSRVSLLRERPAVPLALSRDDILRLPHLGGDFYRALTLLPGTVSNDISAQFHVRGSRRDETQILLDGQELYGAFHLKDYDSALSFVAASNLSDAELATGGFPAVYGDRMSGVLEMTTVRATGPARFTVGASVLNVHAGGSGLFARDRGAWLIGARRGAAEFVDRLIGNEKPEFWDIFGKIDYELGSGQSLRINALSSGDELDFEEVVDDERKRYETEYASSYAWLTHQALLGSDVLVETAGSLVRIDRERHGDELEEDVRFSILDDRDTEIRGIRQSWQARLGEGQTASWGVQLRQSETAYDYFGERDFDNPLARIRHDFGREATELAAAFEDRHVGAFLADRIRLGKAFTVELGLRWDRHSLADSSHVSPRLNLACSVGERTVVRAAWGRYNQSQRTYELQIEDGDTLLYPVERSEHRVIGLERLFAGSSGDHGLALRVELYQREVGNPRPRYENLYEPLNTFPEVEPDRVRIVPERSIAEGVEVFLRGRPGRRLGWWANYAYASTEDEIDGRWIPRSVDATHSLNVDLGVDIASDWRLNLAWRYHTGWPTTPIALEARADDEGELEYLPLLGPLNGDRLSDYHRLDMRISRSWHLRWGDVAAFVDIQNVYDRKNLAGFDFEIDEDRGTLTPVAEEWVGALPSIGFSIEF